MAGYDRNTPRRLEKLKATFDQLIADNAIMAEKLRKRDEPLVQKVRRLEQYVETAQAREDARERILKKLEEDLKEARARIPPTS